MSRSDEFSAGSSPIPEIEASGRLYARRHGLYSPAYDNAKGSVVSLPQSRRMGAAYERLPQWSEEAKPSYDAFANDANKQFEHMTSPVRKGGLGINVEFSDRDPYGGEGARPNDIMREMSHDFLNNRRMRVFKTERTGGHAYYSNEQNDRIRAVHDVFGHLGSGRGIDMHGEEAAFRKHASMFSPLGRQAAATEFRGQTAYLLKNHAFPDQRMALMPQHMMSPQFASIGVNQEDVEDANLENRKQGLM